MPSEGSTLIAYSGSMRQRSDMNPWISLIPRSVYWPLRHMSHSPTAQLGQGTGSGRRTMPTTRSPFLSPPLGPGSSTRPSDSWPSTRRACARGSPAVLALGDLDVRPADADGHGFHEDRALAGVGLGDVLEPGGPGLAGLDCDRLHDVASRKAAAACRLVG